MDSLLKKIIESAGIPGYESEVARLMFNEFKKVSNDVHIDSFGNVIAKKGKGKKKIMLAAHMDEVGLLVKHISKEGFISFIKIGGIDDRILPAQRVIIKAKKGDVIGIIGSKPPHLQKEEDKKHPLKYEDMFIDIGCPGREEAEKKIEIGDAVIFEPNSGVLNGKLYYGKAVDDRVGCYALIKIFEKIKAPAEIYAVATAQEEVGLKGARTSSFKINPDFAIALDTTVAGDTPQIQERESALKLGQGVAITLIEACGRGMIVNEKVKNILIEAARANKIKYQIDVIDGGMTDGAMIYMNREGVPTGVLSIPSRYIHSATGVFHIDDVSAAIDLAIKSVEKMAL
ncbi:MAG: peptidase M42 [Omnitrophica WOR_2 bacterium GWB2_45_9]|nr:MAG: peptidase M42 [Omnitrophica WOR_2 bacterium GWB2_45_9]OGX48572.1 MAG: peptidase M42 [Omnitrophica WOR_2 bacterium RIFOXYA2_FULL_45_12]OGX53859.1 MAG: peptidase M42 [Omnitrophica WOR_2 bacterium RIFOXYB2_FULL_45_11]OGX61490.1 MAG: peptidase M42 [Omnitrophica WOR_2 bacterium RIFOXYC2_FULL_45_15]HBU08029.1 peptidase M42 [Candidatus Omnitrophota bacterium]